MLDRVVVAIGQDTRSKLLFAVIAVESNLKSIPNTTHNANDIGLIGWLLAFWYFFKSGLEG